MAVFEAIDLKVERLLKEAHIASSVLANGSYQLTAVEYKRILEAFDKYVAIDLLVEVSKVDTIAMFVPEFFVGLCASNGRVCIERIAKYKRLIAPVRMHVETTETTTSISYTYEDGSALPRAVQINAYISIVSMIRQGTGNKLLCPKQLLASEVYPQSVETYMGVKTTLSNDGKLLFDNKDLEKAFVTENNRMWDYLGVKLDAKFEQRTKESHLLTRLKHTLLELIPSGVSDMETISSELGMSTRTLTRRLQEEGTTYKKELNAMRQCLVGNYLRAGMSLEEMTFLVNYRDAKSLSRAFKTWTGMSIGQYRKLYVPQ